MMKRLPLLALLALFGCATVTLNATCPATSTGVSFALAGSTVGNQAISMLGSALTAAKILGAPKDEASVAPPPTSATMKYEYVPLFGADDGSLTCVQPIAQTTVVTSPPASIVR
jgi:hypothetical protein